MQTSKTFICQTEPKYLQYLYSSTNSLCFIYNYRNEYKDIMFNITRLIHNIDDFYCGRCAKIIVFTILAF